MRRRGEPGLFGNLLSCAGRMLQSAAMKNNMRTIISIFSIAAVSLFFSACGKDKTPAPAGAPAPVETIVIDPAVLAAKAWTLETLGGAALDKAAYQRMPTLQFDARNTRAYGLTPVNNFSARYTLSGTDLKFRPMLATKMAGPQADMDLETKYTGIFNTVTGWRISGGKLSLLAGDTVLATFGEKTP